jgi:hypothetical protein
MATRYVNNNDGTFTLIRDDGHKQSFIDPDGSFRSELDKMSTGSGEIAGAKGDATASPAPQLNPLAGNSLAIPAPSVSPVQPPQAGLKVIGTNDVISPEAKRQLDAQQHSVNAETAAIASGSNANAGMPQPEPAPTTTQLRIPGSPGEVSTTTTSPQTSVSRTMKDPDGTIAAAQGEALGAQREANAALTEGKRKALENSGRLIMNETLRAETEHRVQEKILNEKETAYADALAARKTARDTPIDPAAAFADDGGAAAIAATIGAAIANVGLAWMGQSAQPINIIDNLVNRSISLQREQRQLNIDEASENVEMNKVQIAEAKANARAALAQQLNSQRAYVQNENELVALDALALDNEAKLKAAEAEYASAIADNVVVQETTGGSSVTTKNGTPDTYVEIPLGSDEEQAGDAVNAARFDSGASAGEQTKATELKDSVVALSQRERILAELEELENKHGAVSDVIGVWKGGRGVAAAVLPGVDEANLQDPNQRRAKDLLDQLEIRNAQDSQRESNSVKRQEMQARNMIPQNDRDLPTFFARGREWVNERKNDQWIGYDPKVVGKVRHELRQRSGGKVEEF